MTVILLRTVGGSHQPIVEAIRSNAPTNVCFFCTDDNPRTGERGLALARHGSRQRHQGPPTGRRSLPNISTQAKLDGDRFENGASR